jgi:hypothetical protein
MAKAVFDPEFVSGTVLNYIINQSKKWLRKNSRNIEIIDIRGSTLNYEEISVLNVVEASAYKGDKK